MSHNAPHYTIPSCPHLGLQSCLCIPASTASPSSSPVCLPPPSTVAGKRLPSSHLYLHCSSPLFTLRSSALAHGAPNSCSIMGSAGAQTAQRHHTALSLSLSDSPPWLREHASHCRHKARPPFNARVASGSGAGQGNCQRRSSKTAKKPNSPSSAFD